MQIRGRGKLWKHVLSHYSSAGIVESYFSISHDQGKIQTTYITPQIQISVVPLMPVYHHTLKYYPLKIILELPEPYRIVC